MTAGKVKLAVSLPAYGGKLDVGHAGMWMSFGFTLAASEARFDLVMFGATDVNPVADARNFAVDAALRAGADWLVMLDSDTYYEGEDPEDIPTGGYQLLEMVSTGQRLHEISRGVGGGLAVNKDGGGASRWAAGVAMIGAPVVSRGWDPPRRTLWIDDDRGVPQVAEEAAYAGKVVEISRLGAACVAVNVAWLRDAWPDPPWYYHARVGGPAATREQLLRSVGEDVAFCDEARRRGGRIYADGRFLPKHVMRAERR